MRALLVVNRKARLGSELGASVRQALADNGVETIAGHAAGAKEAGADCIVAAGGDGTIASVIHHAMKAKIPLGVVPLGTFNELARTLGIPLDVALACEVIGKRRTLAVDVGRVNGTYYLNEASIGFSSRVTRLQTPQEKRRFGIWTAFVSAVTALRHIRPMHAVVRYDDRQERFKTIQLTIANSNRFGGVFVATDAAIDDGWLDLYSIDIHNVFDAFSVIHAMLQGKRETVPGLRTYRATRFDVWTPRRHRISADGEPAGRTPAVFEVLPKALDVFVP